MEELTRLEKFDYALKNAVENCGYPSSPTGMYRCESYEYIDPDGKPQGLIDVMNICAICLFLDDEPYNYGDNMLEDINTVIELFLFLRPSDQLPI